MAALIIPFRRPEAQVPAQAEPQCSPPFIVDFDTSWKIVSFVGTKGQLMAWGVASEAHFPTGRKRLCYNGKSEPTVRRVPGKEGRYKVRHDVTSDDPMAWRRIQNAVSAIRGASDPLKNNASKVLEIMNALRSHLIWSPASKEGLFYEFDDAHKAYEAALAKMVLFEQAEFDRREV